MTKILALDPGKMRDSFAIVGVEPIKDEIHIRLAKRWLGRNYTEVVNKIIAIHLRQNFDHIILETNNTGVVVKELFDAKGIKTIPVNTSSEIRDIKKKMSIQSMDKNEIVRWFIRMKTDHKIKFHGTDNVDIKELMRQIQIFAEHRTDAGNFRYMAPGDEHDDMVMALLLACHMARYYLNKKRNSMSVSSKKVYGDSEDIYGSGVTEAGVIKEKSSYYPS